MFAEVNHSDLEVLFLLLALASFCAAIWAGFTNRIPAAVALAFVAVLILLFAV